MASAATSFAQYNLFWGKRIYMCYDCVHLGKLSDISGYRTVVKPQRTAM